MGIPSFFWKGQKSGLGSRFPKEGKEAGIGADGVEIGVGFSHFSPFLRIKFYGFAEVFDSRIRLLLEGIGTGFVIPGTFVIGLVLEGLVIAGDRFLVPA